MNCIQLVACITALTAMAKVSGKENCTVWADTQRKLLEGEAFYFFSEFGNEDTSEDRFTWLRSKQVISSDEKKRIHAHGFAIYLLNVTTDDAAIYTAEYRQSPTECFTADLTVTVYNESFRLKNPILYGSVGSSAQSTGISCPDPVQETCNVADGKITWYKNMDLLKGQHNKSLYLENVSKHSEEVFTCMCTWKQNHRLYNTSGSRKLNYTDPNASREIKLLSLDKEQFAVIGSNTTLKCSAFCGSNIVKQCVARWEVDGMVIENIEGYNQVVSTDNEPGTTHTIATAVLYIQRVSSKDFLTDFECVVQHDYKSLTFVFNLKPRQTIIPVVGGCLFMLFIGVIGAIIIKLFMVDLTLFLRPYFPLGSAKDGSKVYDAYVIYQLQSQNQSVEKLLSEFVSCDLPAVLEEKCGYKLFIHDRDDTPGEDHLELVERRMTGSRRLMVILTPPPLTPECKSVSPQETAVGGFDWQVGLHQALVQREMSVILVQLGETGPQGFSHLPAGLQHLIQKSAPIKWPELSKNSCKPNSRFWKKVRYLMPARPLAKHRNSDII